MTSVYEYIFYFSSSFPDVPEQSFLKIGADKERLAAFKKGILFVGGENGEFNQRTNKGEVLDAFLEWVHWTPKAIVFFDDELSNLTSVQEELTKKGIPFEG